MSDVPTKVIVDKSTPGYWRVTLKNPPINLIDDSMYDQVYDLVDAMEAEPTLKVVTFESADPDFFIAHYTTAPPKSRFGVPHWIDPALKLARSNALSIAVIRGRVRGAGSEFALACDIRFASRERAIFGQPEVGIGLIPGGGALQRLPLQVGRARALEIILGADDYDAETAERYGWVNRAISDIDLDAFVANYVRRILAFDQQALSTAKQTINRCGIPDKAELQASQDTFFTTYGWPGAVARRPKLLERGLGTAGQFELNLGREIGLF